MKQKLKWRTGSIEARSNLLLEEHDWNNIAFERRNTTIDTGVGKCVEMYTECLRLRKDARLSKYEFLEEVYVVALNAHQHREELFSRAKAMDIRCNKRTGLFALVLMFVTLAVEIDRRRICDYAGALQYLYLKCTPGDQIAKELEKQGGVSGCRDKLSIIKRSDNILNICKPSPARSKDIWREIQGQKIVARLKPKGGDLVSGRQILLAENDSDGVVSIYKSISLDDEKGIRLLKLLLNSL